MRKILPPLNEFNELFNKVIDRELRGQLSDSMNIIMDQIIGDVNTLQLIVIKTKNKKPDIRLVLLDKNNKRIMQAIALNTSRKNKESPRKVFNRLVKKGNI